MQLFDSVSPKRNGNHRKWSEKRPDGPSVSATDLSRNEERAHYCEYAVQGFDDLSLKDFEGCKPKDLRKLDQKWRRT